MFDVFIWRSQKYNHIVRINLGKLPFYFCQYDVYRRLKRTWAFLSPNAIRVKQFSPQLQVNAVFHDPAWQFQSFRIHS